MARPDPTLSSVFFESSGAFRAWLEHHASTESELLVGYYKVGTGKPSLTWPESVDEALCFGWIDGVRRRIDEQSYQIRFTPRRRGSIWSAVNITKARALIAEGRMQPAGLEAFERRTERKSRVYAYEQNGESALMEEERRKFEKNQAAWRYFEACPPSYRKIVLYWLASAKRAATRERRLAKLIAASAVGERLFK